MVDTEHRPTLSPEFVGRLASSMESLRQAWDADVTDLRATKAELTTTQQRLATSDERLQDIAQDFRDVRNENIKLIQQVARLEAQLQLLIVTSRDAGEHLNALAARAENSAPAPATPDTESSVRAAFEIELAERGRSIDDETQVHDDGRALTVDDVPLFLRNAPPLPHRTTMAPNAFLRANNH